MTTPTPRRGGRTGRCTPGARDPRQVLVELVWCDSAWCGEVFDAADGWAGRCPSCLALADEHLAGGHTDWGRFVEACSECHREGGARSTRRSA
jgi:hypothetical protein